MDEITQTELNELILSIEDRHGYLSTQLGASSELNGVVVRDLCAAYRLD